MEIEFERSGGFAGIVLRTNVKTEQLAADEVSQLDDLLNQAGFFQLPTRITAATPGADRFQYKIAVRQSRQKHTVQVGEAAIPANLRPLVDWLMAKARQP